MFEGKQIAQFIKESFEELGLDISEYFFYSFEDDEWTEMEWLDSEGNLRPHLLPFVSEKLGISEKDILNCKDKSVIKWLSKYPYFQYIQPFNIAYERTFYHGEYYDRKRIYESVFGDASALPCPSRFNYHEIANRLVNQLKELDKSIPGTFHEDAQITNLQISTDNICHFEPIEEMVNSFISMVERAVYLFLKAIKEKLISEEIKEYNLLVSVLGIRDKYFTKGYLYYMLIYL